MKYGSICSGIGSEHVAWEGLDWECMFFSEIDEFASGVLKEHYPEVKNIGDFMHYEWTKEDCEVELLIGGTPCQSFSLSGKRLGLDDLRGNLTIEFLRIIQRIKPRWFVWENVPGILSSNKGRDFGFILGKMAELGYGFAYRILDAQFFGVPQRRRRVFVVGYFGDWRPPTAVLFEQGSMSGDFKTCKESKEKDTAKSKACFREKNYGMISNCLTTKQRYDFESEVFVVKDQTIRKFTPIECERLQGLPDNYTLIPWRGKSKEKCPKTQRYKVIGNGFAVPVVKWIGERIKIVDIILKTKVF